MKIINHKKIFYFALAFFVLPFFSGAQTFSEHIQDIQWNLTPDIFSVTGGGVITTDIPNPSFRWQIELGYAGNVTTNPDQTFNVSGPDLWQVPQGEANYFTSSPNHLTPLGGNQFSFNMPSNFQTTLWPATRYYLDIWEWDDAPTQAGGRTIRDYAIFQTQPIQELNLNINQLLNGDVQMTLQVPSSVNVYNPMGGVAIQGMPVNFNILTENRSGQLMNDENQALAIFAGTQSFDATGTLVINVPIGTNLDQETSYWIKLINGDPNGGGLLLLNEDIEFSLPAEDEQEEPATGGGGGGSNQGFPDSGQEFESGLITCGQEGLPECDFEQLLLLVNKVLRFLIFVIGVPIITLSFAYAGFLMVTSGGNPSKKDEAKSIIGNAIVGLIVLLAAWLIVRTVLIIFGYSGPLLGILGS